MVHVLSVPWRQWFTGSLGMAHVHLVAPFVAVILPVHPSLFLQVKPGRSWSTKKISQYLLVKHCIILFQPAGFCFKRARRFQPRTCASFCLKFQIKNDIYIPLHSLAFCIEFVNPFFKKLYTRIQYVSMSVGKALALQSSWPAIKAASVAATMACVTVSWKCFVKTFGTLWCCLEWGWNNLIHEKPFFASLDF